MKRTFLTLIVLATLTVSLKAQQAVTGPAKIIDGTTMQVKGRTLTLAHIKTVKPGTFCTIKNHERDCGVLARAGLQDLVVGGDVTCRKSKTSPGYVCRSGGYDLAFGLVHAGWAVPTASAPKYYFARAKLANKRQLALWGAKGKGGKIVANTLRRKVH